MKKKEIMDQLRDMSVEELREQAESLRESLFRLKFKKSLGVGESINDTRRERKTLARVFTLIQQKEPQRQARKAKV